ncbi:MAG: TIGR00299 family protein [Deltaproteobacteria bacterium]|nr:TIGR00299 family protein [Deltaproteobacteria bacterium]
MWLDAPGGAAGDMILAALIDAGAPVERVRDVLDALHIGGWSMQQTRTMRCSIAATHVRFQPTGAHATAATATQPPAPAHSHAHTHSHAHAHNHAHVHAHSDGATTPPAPGEEQPFEDQPHRAFRDICTMLEAAPIPATIRARAVAIFERLAHAEARVHDTTPAEVVFHEVGSVDAILDIVGVCAALDALDVDLICCGPLPVGRGFVRCAHGRMPLPAPATLYLMEGWPTVPGLDRVEQVTPTGAAIWVTIAAATAPPEMVVESVGYGAGARSFDDRPNVVRAVLGRRSKPKPTTAVTTTLAQVDDMPGEHIPPLIDALLAAGALDVTITPCVMKKGRPGMRLEAISRPERADQVAHSMLRHASTFGVRQWQSHRTELERHHQSVETQFGPVRVKVGTLDGKELQAAPEYADVAKLARQHEVPTSRVYAAAVHAWHLLSPPSTSDE